MKEFNELKECATLAKKIELALYILNTDLKKQTDEMTLSSEQNLSALLKETDLELIASLQTNLNRLKRQLSKISKKLSK